MVPLAIVYRELDHCWILPNWDQEVSKGKRSVVGQQWHLQGLYETRCWDALILFSDLQSNAMYV